MTDIAKKKKSAMITKRVFTAVKYVFLGISALTVLFPFYYMIITSLKSYGAYNGESVPELIPTSPTAENYLLAKLFKRNGSKISSGIRNGGTV